MALPSDRVQALKVESTSRGGDDADSAPYTTPIEPWEDALEARGLYFQDEAANSASFDEAVLAWRDGNDLKFKDVNNASGVSLTDLLDNGPLDGSGDTNRLTFWQDTDTLTSNANLTFDGTRLTVPTAEPTSDYNVATKKYVDDNLGSGISGSGAAGQVAIFDGTSSITGDSSLTWQESNGRMLISGSYDSSAVVGFTSGNTSANAAARARHRIQNHLGYGCEMTTYATTAVGDIDGEAVAASVAIRADNNKMFVGTSTAEKVFLMANNEICIDLDGSLDAVGVKKNTVFDGQVGIGSIPGGAKLSIQDSLDGTMVAYAAQNTSTNAAARVAAWLRNHSNKEVKFQIYSDTAPGSWGGESLAGAATVEGGASKLFVGTTTAASTFLVADTIPYVELNQSADTVDVKKALNCLYPTANDHAATKQYVDEQVGPGSNTEIGVFDASGTLQGDPAFYWDGAFARVVDAQSGSLGIIISNSGTDVGSRAWIGMRGPGTTSTKLDLRCYSPTDGGSFGSVSKNSAVALESKDASSLLVGTTDAAPLHLMSSGTPRMTFESGGDAYLPNRLAIARSASPSFDLHIGTGESGDNRFGFQKGNGVNSAGFLRFGDNSGWAFHIGRGSESSGGAINSGPTNGVLMTIRDNGNVGIGLDDPSDTSTPTHKLTLVGGNGTDFTIYNGADDATNYERLTMGWTTNAAYLRTEDGGTGTPRNFYISAATGGDLYISNGGVSGDYIYFRYGTTVGWSMDYQGNLTGNTGTQIKADGGSASAPPYAFNGDVNTGMFSAAQDEIGFTLGTSETIRFHDDAIQVTETSAPSTPSSGKGEIYAKTDGHLYFKNDIGTEYDLTGGSGSLSGTGLADRLPRWIDSSTLGYAAISYGSGGNLGVGDGIYASTPELPLHVVDSSSVPCAFERHSTSTNGPQLLLRRSRGSAASGSHTDSNVTSSDELGGLQWQGYYGQWQAAAGIYAYVDGTPGTAPDMPGRLEFKTSQDGSFSLETRVTVDSLAMTINGDTSSDPKLVLDVDGGTDWEIFVDDSDSDTFQISAVGGTQRYTLHSSGYHGWGGSRFYMGGLFGDYASWDHYTTNGLVIRDSAADAALSRDMYGVGLVCGTGTNGYYTPAIKFMSDATAFGSNETPRFLAGIVGRITETYSSATSGGMKLLFLTTDDGGGSDTGVPTERMAILEDGTVSLSKFFSSNVGIGAQPGYPLHVEGNQSGFIALFFNDGNSTSREGIVVQCGADTPSGSYTTAYVLGVDGNGTNIGYLGDVNGTFGTTDLSDRRLKHDIAPTAVDGLDVVNRLNVVEFRYNRHPDHLHPAGFIAQEVQEVYPEMVSEHPDTEGETTLSTMRSALVPVLVKAIQEQQELIQKLTSRIEALEAP